MTQTGWGSGTVASSWVSTQEARNRMMAEATERMFAEARVGPGSRVLDIGTGTGDTALLAAARVGPTGHVTATDGSTAMVVAAQEAVRRAGVTNVTVSALDLREVDLPPERFDAVIGRNVLMFVPLPRVLVKLRDVLRPGGRLASIVWSALANNPFHRIILDAARTRGGWGDAPPEMARAFAQGDPNVYRRTLEGAGFRDVAVHVVHSVRRFDSARAGLEWIRASPVTGEPVFRLPVAKQAEAWEEIEAGLRAFELDGVCELPMESLVLVGER